MVMKTVDGFMFLYLQFVVVFHGLNLEYILLYQHLLKYCT